MIIKYRPIRVNFQYVRIRFSEHLGLPVANQRCGAALVAIRWSLWFWPQPVRCLMCFCVKIVFLPPKPDDKFMSFFYCLFPAKEDLFSELNFYPIVFFFIARTFSISRARAQRAVLGGSVCSVCLILFSKLLINLIFSFLFIFKLFLIASISSL